MTGRYAKPLGAGIITRATSGCVKRCRSGGRRVSNPTVEGSSPSGCVNTSHIKSVIYADGPDRGRSRYALTPSPKTLEFAQEVRLGVTQNVTRPTPHPPAPCRAGGGQPLAAVPSTGRPPSVAPGGGER
jgi:hypothetical protein